MINFWKENESRLFRIKQEIIFVLNCTKTDSGILVEYTKVFELITQKELGKFTL